MIQSLLAIAAVSFAQNVSIEVDVKDGEVIAVERTFVVKVKSKNPVNQVEFYVGDDLRETDSSTPYEFHLDALSETEGPMTLKFSAYASDGESASKTFTVTIDNGLSKGAEFHIQRADELLAVSKWDEAIRAGKIALKVKPGNNAARLRMARAYLGKGVLDQAQKHAEDALNSDPNLLEAADLLSGINLKRAFATYKKESGDQKEVLASIGVAFKSAVKNRKKILEAAVDKLGTSGKENLLPYSDAAMRAGRYSAAILALSPAFRADSREGAIANRLAYAQMRSARFQDALLTLTENNRQGGLDAYGWGLMSVLKTLAGDFAAADDAMRQAVLSDSEDLGVRTSQAFVALARRRTQTLGQLATNLAKDEGQRSDVNYYLSVLHGSLGNFEASRDAFERSVLAEPTNSDMYVARANESLRIVATGRLGQNPDESQKKQIAYHVAAAKMFYEAALEARPESAEALTGITLVNIMDKKTPDALRYARAAVAAAPGYAAGHYVLSQVTSTLDAEYRAAAERILRSPKDGVLTSEQRAEYQKLLDEANRLGKEARTASDNAGKLDPVNLQGRELPKGNVAYDYFAKNGRIPLISAPK